MDKVKARTLSGFMELLPAPQQQMEVMFETLRRIYSLYGFTPLDTPAIEAAEVRYLNVPFIISSNRSFLESCCK